MVFSKLELRRLDGFHCAHTISGAGRGTSIRTNCLANIAPRQWKVTYVPFDALAPPRFALVGEEDVYPDGLRGQPHAEATKTVRTSFTTLHPCDSQRVEGGTRLSRWIARPPFTVSLGGPQGWWDARRSYAGTRLSGLIASQVIKTVYDSFVVR